MIFGPFRIDVEALVARVLLRWHYKVACTFIAFTLVCGVVSGIIPPMWRGQAQLTVSAPTGALVTVDGIAWPYAVYAGDHRIRAVMPDGRTSWTDVTLIANTPLTVMLPPGLPQPQVRPLPPTAPGMTAQRIWWADRGWRVQSAPAAADASPSPNAYTVTAPLPDPEQTVAFTAEGVEPLATVDAFGGIADVVQRPTTVEAVYRPVTEGVTRAGLAGSVDIRGWDDAGVSVPVSNTVTMVRLAPDVRRVLVAEQAGTAEQVSVITRDGTVAPLVAVRGEIKNIVWSPDSTAALITSNDNDRLTLTLARIVPTLTSRVVADMVLPTTRNNDAVLMMGVPWTWSPGDALEWIAPDDAGVASLWRAPFQSLIPERIMALDAIAIRRDAAGVLRMITTVAGRTVVARMDNATQIVEADLPDISLVADRAFVGHWAPAQTQAIVTNGSRAWIVDVAPDSTTQTALTP